MEPMSDDGFMSIEKENGEPFRPSNGTEGEYFKRRHCYQCELWQDAAGCEIDIDLHAMVYDVEDDRYPEEWQWQDGDPTCTEFQPTEDDHE